MPTENELWIEVFKTGEHTDSEGFVKEWTDEDLELIETKYNEALATNENLIAPVVKGHPKDNDPAFGWVESLKKEGNILFAKIKDLIPTFVEEVKQGMFKKVSVSLQPDLMLRHVGFLGAVPPAVKGLANVSFSEVGTNAKFMLFTFDFAEDPINNPNPTPSPTIDEVKIEQEKRAKLYGIGVKDKIGYISKPEAYKDLTDEQFGDPVNYLYPVNDIYNLIASQRTMRLWDCGYTDIEKQVVVARILKSAEALGIDIKKDLYLSFSEQPLNFSIQLREEWKRDKPERWKDYKDEDFADPIHFRFPVKSRSETKASLAIFSKEKVFSQYSNPEQQLLAARLIVAMDKHGINRNYKVWKYNEFGDVRVPVELLNKRQLVDVVNAFVNIQEINQNNKSNNNYEEATMPEDILALIQWAVSWLSTNVSEEMATQFQGEVDTWVAENIKPAEPGPDGGSPAGTEPTQMSEEAKRITELETKLRMKEFSEKLNSLTNLTPVQRDMFLPVLELAHQSDEKKSTFNFNDSGKTKKATASEIVEKILGTIPASVDFNEFDKTGRNGGKPRTNDNLNFSEDSQEKHNRILNYIQEQKKQGIEVSYQAAALVISGDE